HARRRFQPGPPPRHRWSGARGRGRGRAAGGQGAVPRTAARRYRLPQGRDDLLLPSRHLPAAEPDPEPPAEPAPPLTGSVASQRPARGSGARRLRYYGSRRAERITIAGLRCCPSAVARWILRTTGMPFTTRPKAAKPWPSALRLPP